MLKTLRTLTAVAAIAAAGLPQMANAALVTTTIDFENVGTLATQYNDAAHGFTTISSLADLSTVPGTPPTHSNINNHSLFNSCVLTDCQNDPVTFSIADGLQSDGSANTAVHFDLWVDAAVIVLEYLNSDQAWVSLPGSIPAQNTVSGWLDVSVPLAAGTYYGLRFFGTPGAWAIDNLSFSVIESTTNVPEPSSVALVALALAGAASIARRRQQR